MKFITACTYLPGHLLIRRKSWPIDKRVFYVTSHSKKHAIHSFNHHDKLEEKIENMSTEDYFALDWVVRKATEEEKTFINDRLTELKK